jgi:hypothetical protein
MIINDVIIISKSGINRISFRFVDFRLVYLLSTASGALLGQFIIIPQILCDGTV